MIKFIHPHYNFTRLVVFVAQFAPRSPLLVISIGQYSPDLYGIPQPGLPRDFATATFRRSVLT